MYLRHYLKFVTDRITKRSKTAKYRDANVGEHQLQKKKFTTKQDDRRMLLGHICL